MAICGWRLKATDKGDGMVLGLIGKPLVHSWSDIIHRHLIGADYRMWELEKDKVGEFLTDREFDGINVTIPYKSTVMEYLDSISEEAERIGAVNCIVNTGHRLEGYNTDIYGLKYVIAKHGFHAENGAAAILGTGGAGKMAAEVCRQMGWKMYMVSRSGAPGSISYDELYDRENEIEMIINAGPAGMFPDIDRVPVDISRFTSLRYVIDLIANPVRSRMVQEAGAGGLKAAGGLEMLVAQAYAADELFTGTKLDPGMTEAALSAVCRDKLNIVITGMPSAGKTTVGKLLADALDRELADTDEMIESRIGMPIRDYFAEYGEDAFRDLESEVCAELSMRTGLIIATGGGAVKREENIRRLAGNGVIMWLDRSPGKLVATESRPLSSSREALEALYRERLDLYAKYSDFRIVNEAGPEDAADMIMKKMEELQIYEISTEDNVNNSANNNVSNNANNNTNNSVNNIEDYRVE